VEGLERFEGTLWVDGSVFAGDPYPEGWAHEDLVYSYSAQVNGVLANGNAVLLTATGSEKGAVVSLAPPESPLTVRGQVSLGPPGSAPRLWVHRDLGSTVIEVAGSVPPGAVARQSVAVTDPDSTAGLLLLGAMMRAGIETKAEVRVLPERPEDAETKRKDVGSLLASVAAAGAVEPWSAARKDRSIVALALLSPTAAEIVSMVNTFSLNTEAEALLRMLDPAPRGKRAERGIAELSRLLSEAGIDTADVLFSDGSGLSRMDLATARAVVGWLAALDRDPALGSLFREGLSTPGGSGTLANRLPDLEPGVSLRGKTGTLRNVSALSGYVTAAGGERFAFTLIANGTRGSVAPARAAQDELVRVLARVRREAPPPTGRPWGMPR
jgi:serine-type D-Ala-D-Ala carboxypeptidase/endopeptidase (penicillin-binding protein 4)